MATAGLGALAVVSGSAAVIAALTSTDTRVVTAVGRDSSVVELPPADEAELGSQDAVGEKAGGRNASGRDAGDRNAGLPNTGHAGAEAADDGRSKPDEADRTATRTPRRTTLHAGRNPAAAHAGGSARTAGPGGPVVRVERISESESIPFRTRLVRDPSLPPGSRAIQTPGIPGERILHYEVTFTGSKETGRRLIDSTVTREPQPRIVAFGNRRGGVRPGGGRGHPGECRLAIGPCIGLGRGTVCIDRKGEQGEQGLIDGDLSLLTPADIDELQLKLPCIDEPKDAAKDPAKDVPKATATDPVKAPATVAATDGVADERPQDGNRG
jgi:hypothetical protein